MSFWSEKQRHLPSNLVIELLSGQNLDSLCSSCQYNVYLRHYLRYTSPVKKSLRKSLRYISPVKNPFGNPFDYRFRVKYPFENPFEPYFTLRPHLFRKSQDQNLYRFRSSVICKKRLGAKRPPPLRIVLN